MARVIAWMIILAEGIFGWPAWTWTAEYNPLAGVTASSAVVIDAQTGKALYARGANQSRPPASTTKIMTALLALESANLTDQVTVSARAASIGESSIGLVAGETLSLEDLLYSLLLVSANDAAVAIAEHVAGSVEAFVDLMNRKARELGATMTNFANPHGLHHPEHYSTAFDLALIARQAMTIPEYRTIVATEQFTISRQRSNVPTRLTNKNQLLTGARSSPGADGIKNGYTREAGNCLVGSATRDGWQLIAVALNSSDVYLDVGLLLDYGFKNYVSTILVKSGQQVAWAKVSRGALPRVPVIAGEQFAMVLPRGNEVTIRREVSSLTLEAPVDQGSTAGLMQLFVDNQLVGQVPLVSETGVERQQRFPLLQTLWQAFVMVVGLF